MTVCAYVYCIVVSFAVTVRQSDRRIYATFHRARVPYTYRMAMGAILVHGSLRRGAYVCESDPRLALQIHSGQCTQTWNSSTTAARRDSHMEASSVLREARRSSTYFLYPLPLSGSSCLWQGAPQASVVLLNDTPISWARLERLEAEPVANLWVTRSPGACRTVVEAFLCATSRRLLSHMGCVKGQKAGTR